LTKLAERVWSIAEERNGGNHPAAGQAVLSGLVRGGLCPWPRSGCCPGCGAAACGGCGPLSGAAVPFPGELVMPAVPGFWDRGHVRGGRGLNGEGRPSFGMGARSAPFLRG